MKNTNFNTLLSRKIPVFDGAMGTLIQNLGVDFSIPEELNFTQPDKIEAIHRAYFAAGADVVSTNTFGASSHKLAGSGLSPSEVVTRAVEIAKRAAARNAAARNAAARNASLPHGGLVALDIGPIGALFAPSGDLTFGAAYEMFAEQMIAGQAAGADLILIETMTGLSEARCALLAAKENTTLPVGVTMSFEKNGRTFEGVPASSAAITLAGLGADFLGVNCSVGPADLADVVDEFLRYTDLPIIVQPNAGLPCIHNGHTTFDLSPDGFAAAMRPLIEHGVSIIGGCCGTTPEYIGRIAALVKGKKPPQKRNIIDGPYVCSATKTVEIDRVRIIGERINPTGKKLFKQALIDGNIDYVVRQAIEQVEAGADILDVNVGVPGLDEAATIVKVIGAVGSVTDAPLQLDSSSPAAIEAGLRAYPGKAIVNSVNGEDESLDAVLPLVKKYGAAVVGLLMDKRGIPRTAEERLSVADKIIAATDKIGIPRSDVFIDCLTLTAGAEQAIAYETIRALQLVKEKYGVKTVLGVSNISFGLPAREVMNRFFLSAALTAGLDLPIINPNVREMTDAVFCYHQLRNLDIASERYIERFSGEVYKTAAVAAQTVATTTSAASMSTTAKPAEESKIDMLYYITKGLREQARATVVELLTTSPPLDIVNGHLIPALDSVGSDFEKGKIFLPQLLRSAEAAGAAFEPIKAAIAKNPSAKTESKKIVLATVKGDVHDIGKNIVKAVLENYGYEIVDLGKNVPPEAVLAAAREHNARLVGLSALMTTTVPNMADTIKLLRAHLPQVKIMVGGAVLTEEYARQIGADFYGKDAMASAAYAKTVFN